MRAVVEECIGTRHVAMKVSGDKECIESWVRVKEGFPEGHI